MAWIRWFNCYQKASRTDLKTANREGCITLSKILWFTLNSGRLQLSMKNKLMQNESCRCHTTKHDQTLVRTFRNLTTRGAFHRDRPATQYEPNLSAHVAETSSKEAPTAYRSARSICIFNDSTWKNTVSQVHHKITDQKICPNWNQKIRCRKMSTD